MGGEQVFERAEECIKALGPIFYDMAHCVNVGQLAGKKDAYVMLD